jgi:Spy/CpxP family protein refolding chaperone
MKTLQRQCLEGLKSRTSLFVILCAGTLLIASCSTKNKAAEMDLERQIHAQPEASSPKEIENRAAEAFANAPGLTNEQKAKLKVIYQRVYAEASGIRKEIGQSKSMMFQLVANNDYRSADIQRLQNKIVALDLKRLDIMFKALEEVQGVIGYGKDKDELYWRLRHYEFPLERGFLLSQ